MTEQPDEREGLPSASPWRSYELCAGKWQLEQKARELGQMAHERSVDAARGDLIHNFLAGIPDEDGKEIRLEEDEQTTADFLQERAQGEVPRIFGDEPTQQLNEKRLWLELKGKKMLSGRFDRVIYTANKALVQDFKTGWSEPDPAEQNAQLKVLAVLVALAMPATLQEVIVQIVSGPFGVSEARYDLPALAKAYSDILATLRAIEDPYAILAPQPAACRFCNAVNICPAVRNLVPKMIEVEALPDGERGAKLLDEVAVLQNRLDSLREYYSAKLSTEPSFDLPGYVMVPGNVVRTVTDWEAARKRLAEWLDLPEIEGAANYRLGELEKALGKKLKLKGKDLKERTNEILKGLIEEKQNAASLKRVSGKAKLVEIESCN